MPAAANSSFRFPYAALGSVVAIMLALWTGYAASGERRSSTEARLTATEITLANHLKEAALQEERNQTAAAAHEKRMNDHFAASQAENAELQKTLTELRIVVARQRP